MEIVIAVALFIGVVAGTWRAITCAVHRRLRNALQLSTDQHTAASAEVDLLRRTLKITEASLARRDARIADLDASYRAATQQTQRDELPPTVRGALWPHGVEHTAFRVDPTTPASYEQQAGRDERVVEAAAIAGDDDCSAIVPAGGAA